MTLLDPSMASQVEERFREHEIDGRALQLLSTRNIIHDMGIKLGSALKIVDAFKKLTDQLRKNTPK